MLPSQSERQSELPTTDEAVREFFRFVLENEAPPKDRWEYGREFNQRVYEVGAAYLRGLEKMP